MELEIETGTICLEGKERSKGLDDWARRKVMEEMEEKKSLQCLRWPKQGWRKNPCIQEERGVLTLVAFRVGCPEMGLNNPSLKYMFGPPKDVECRSGELCIGCLCIAKDNSMECYAGPFTNHSGRIINCPLCDAQNIDMTHIIVECRALEEFRNTSMTKPGVSMKEFLATDGTAVERARAFLNDGFKEVGQTSVRGGQLLAIRELWLESWMELWVGEQELEVLSIGESSQRNSR